MRALTTAALLILVTSLAHAGPAGRFGMTFAVADEGAPLQHQFGPMLGVGIPLGRFVAEVDYAYLSFMEPDTTDGGMHRFGVNVRADLYHGTNVCFARIGCSRGIGLYGEIGAAMRYGQWHLDANSRSPAASDRQRELHIGIGLELDNQIVPTRLGWNFGLRLAVAPRDDLMIACRGASCATDGSVRETGELDMALLVEWMFIAGR